MMNQGIYNLYKQKYILNIKLCFQSKLRFERQHG